MNMTIQESNLNRSLICRQRVAPVDEITFNNCILTWFNLILDPFSCSMEGKTGEERETPRIMWRFIIPKAPFIN